jgi:hypothetical protein
MLTVIVELHWTFDGSEYFDVDCVPSFMVHTLRNGCRQCLRAGTIILALPSWRMDKLRNFGEKQPCHDDLPPNVPDENPGLADLQEEAGGA